MKLIVLLLMACPLCHAAPQTERSTRRTIARLFHRLARERGLRPGTKIAIAFADATSSQTPRGRRIAAPLELALYGRLGIAPQAITNGATLGAAAGIGQAKVYFEPETKRLLVSTQLDPIRDRFVLTQQLGRALQHLAPRLRRYRRYQGLSSDQRLAREAWLKATSVGFALESVVLKAEGADLGSAKRMLAPLLKAFLAANPPAASLAAQWHPLVLFPYQVGVPLLARLRRDQGWPRLNRYYARPWRSTAELIHGVRLRQHRVHARSLRQLRSFSLLKEDTFGELQLRTLLSQQLGPQNAARAAAGWRGDRLALLLPKHPEAKLPPGPSRPRQRRQLRAKPPAKVEAPPRPDALVVVLLTSWRNSLEAKEFAFALERHSLVLGTVDERHSRPTRTLIELPDGKRGLIRRAAAAVLWIVGASPETLEGLELDVWRHWRINGRALPRPLVAAPHR